MEKEKDGVWRTIRGRRIFIGKGEDLATAMKNSGKFKREDIRQGKGEARLQNSWHKLSINKKQTKGTKRSFEKNLRKSLEPTREDYYNQDEKNRINEYAHIEGSGQTRVQRNWNKYSEEDRREHRHELIQKKLADYRNEKEIPSSEELFKAKEKRAMQNKQDAKNLKASQEKLVNDLVNQNKDLSDWDIEQEAMNRNLDKNKVIADYKAKKQSNNKIQNNNDEFDMRKYTIELQHDKGTKKIDTVASSKESAIKNVLKNENAPDSAVKSVKDNGSILNKQSNNKQDYIQDTAKEKISYNTARQLLNDLNNEGSDFTFGEIEVDKYNKDFKEDGNIKTEVSVFMPDDRGYVSRELNIPIDKNETRASLEEKLRDWQSRHNSPDSFYDDDFEDKAKKRETIKNYVEKKKSNNIDYSKIKVGDTFQQNINGRIYNIEVTRKNKDDYTVQATSVIENGKKSNLFGPTWISNLVEKKDKNTPKGYIDLKEISNYKKRKGK